MANFWDNDEVVELGVQPEVAAQAQKAENTGTNFWDKDTIVGLTDLAATSETPAPISEDPDRQFYQSGVSLEDRVFEPELSDKIANESTAPLSEVDPERRADEEFLRTGQLPETAPSTSLRPKAIPTQPDFVDYSLNQILVAEGGFQDDKEDSGNYLPDGTLVGTNRGITPVALAEFKGVDPNSITVSDIKAITENDARAIYRQNYFDKPRIGQLPQDLQASVFDMFINSGSNAIKILQKAAGLPKSQQDGLIGPMTLAAVTSANVSKEDYADARIVFYKELVKRKPKTKKYLNGWITRANKYR